MFLEKNMKGSKIRRELKGRLEPRHWPRDTGEHCPGILSSPLGATVLMKSQEEEEPWKTTSICPKDTVSWGLDAASPIC